MHMPKSNPILHKEHENKILENGNITLSKINGKWPNCYFEDINACAKLKLIFIHSFIINSFKISL